MFKFAEQNKGSLDAEKKKKLDAVCMAKTKKSLEEVTRSKNESLVRRST